MCQFRLEALEFETLFKQSYDQKFATELEQLDSFFDEGILEGSIRSMKVTDLGRLFVRNVAMVFDAYWGKTSQKATYSKTV